MSTGDQLYLLRHQPGFIATEPIPSIIRRSKDRVGRVFCD